MKTTQLIALACSLVACTTLRAEMEADFGSDAVAQIERSKSEAGHQFVAEAIQDAGFQKGGMSKRDALIAFGLFASTLGMVVLLNALRLAPEGYEESDGFHFSIQKVRTNPVRHIRRSLAHT